MWSKEWLVMYSSTFSLLGERDSPPTTHTHTHTQTHKPPFFVVAGDLVLSFWQLRRTSCQDIRRLGEEQDQEEEEEEGKTLIHHLKQERG